MNLVIVGALSSTIEFQWYVIFAVSFSADCQNQDGKRHKKVKFPRVKKCND